MLEAQRNLVRCRLNGLGGVEGIVKSDKWVTTSEHPLLNQYVLYVLTVLWYSKSYSMSVVGF